MPRPAWDHMPSSFDIPTRARHASPLHRHYFVSTILSAAKNLVSRASSCLMNVLEAWYARDEILRCAQNDKGGGGSLASDIYPILHLAEVKSKVWRKI
jgi:hypothetical protein